MTAVAFSRSVLKKTDGGQVTAKAHYIAREGVYSPAIEKVEYLGETRERNVRDDLIDKGTHHLPHWATSASEYFSAAEKHERANGVVATEWKFDLPVGLTRTAQRALIADVVEIMLPHNPVTWALHEPLGLGGQPHPHVHMLWSAREEDGIQRTPEQFFGRWNAAHPEQGGAQKSPALNEWRAPVTAKRMYTDLANLRLEHAQEPTRFHPGSYRERGIAITPEPKLYPSDSKAYYTGKANERMQKVLDHRAAMAPHREEEATDAQQYWERRKVDLGITREMTADQARERVAQGRSVVTTARLSVAEREQLTARTRTMERYGADLDTELTHYSTQGSLRPAKTVTLLAEAERLGLGEEGDGIQRGRTRLHIFDHGEEQGYGR